MKNHDISVGEMLDAEDEAAIGLLGREPELQFVRLAAAYNDQKKEVGRLRGRIAAIWEQLTPTEQNRVDAALLHPANNKVSGPEPAAKGTP